MTHTFKIPVAMAVEKKFDEYIKEILKSNLTMLKIETDRLLLRTLKSLDISELVKSLFEN